MKPVALANALLHERGIPDEVSLPVQVVFDGIHRVRLDAPSPTMVEATCVLDGVLPASDLVLRENLLQWNLHAGMVGPGSLGVDRTGDRIVLRLALPTDGLSLEAFKAEMQAFLARVEHLNGVLVTAPLDYEAALPSASPREETSAPPLGGAGFISV